MMMRNGPHARAWGFPRARVSLADQEPASSRRMRITDTR